MYTSSIKRSISSKEHFNTVDRMINSWSLLSSVSLRQEVKPSVSWREALAGVRGAAGALLQREDKSRCFACATIGMFLCFVSEQKCLSWRAQKTDWFSTFQVERYSFQPLYIEFSAESVQLCCHEATVNFFEKKWKFFSVFEYVSRS